MSGERASYVDSSALVKLAVAEIETAALRAFLRGRRPLVSSALARTEVGRALLPWGPDAVRRGQGVLARIDLIRISDALLDTAAALAPDGLRSLDAIHLATADAVGDDLDCVITYDRRMATAAEARGWRVIAPS